MNFKIQSIYNWLNEKKIWIFFLKTITKQIWIYFGILKYLGQSWLIKIL